MLVLFLFIPKVLMTSVSGTQASQVSQAEPVTLKNSPIAYGLGSFGLESTYKVFWGFYVFYYVDILGLGVALMAIINIVYAICVTDVNLYLGGCYADI